MHVGRGEAEPNVMAVMSLWHGSHALLREVTHDDDVQHLERIEVANLILDAHRLAVCSK